ncbi:Crp/Fnr family transcriptional regulator [Bacillus canaveralius]|uniref:Crp/Fnr family transcriptional regulator n=1 Tax=Bacillus canaveralius TaxID=1403243 RepID=A0A2N5GN57_9BACI|nr:MULTISPECIES: DoxX family protein [Bacillus]PLR83638.1 Crp/Fnr family transcriptional regulator [Bacillus canaveralius]PLR86917.1 Crp/Fnr family transcriptional regulator [Bacillus sp. V33-4]PLR90817.1 Crp/Fnr family transcriptional regulator [Bacillus canaveralius]RSK53284.1 DoxX family protein [Bacillus canaveralius]
MKWWKTPQAAIAWTIIRIWLGIQWIEAGWHKVADGFDAGGFMQGAIAKAGGDHPMVAGWYANFLESVAIPNSGLFSFLVSWGEILVGLGLILGAATIPALIAGAFMNLNFMLAGTTSTNPVLYTVAFILLFAGSGSYYWGVDRLAIPYLKERFIKKASGVGENTAAQ